MGVLLVIVAVLGIFFKSVQPENEAHKETVRLAKKYAHLKKRMLFIVIAEIRFYTVFGTNADNQKFTPLFRKTAKKSTSTVKKTASLLKQPKKQSENGRTSKRLRMSEWV